ncbi:glycosyltransferase [Methylococcus sp. EFPC2]|uniref:glycosyltransferase family 2 protein n=1 Tax=Methylococcus sp. EFPC2 TaxID=2812648 RepID=UPI00196775E5|nr:glycosyltransferase [Methylococcus sp. EFPC2]QSA95593.1 glycosyltransferase [Methylococcus sp. EFPC2]
MDKNNFLITAIVSVYNAERFISGCLEDLERQTIASQLEIIVVDSGSSQREGEVVRAYQERFTNIRYIRTETRETIYQAWNRAIATAQGKYLTNANADDRHRPDALEKLVDALEINSNAAVAYADSFVTDVENEVWPSQNITGVFHWPKYEARRLFQICFIGPQPVWRRDLHGTHGLFDGNLRSAGDYEFWLRIAAAGVCFVHVPEVLGLYLASPVGVELSNKTLSNTEAEHARQQHWPRRWGALPRSSPSFLFPSLHQTPLVSVVVATFNRPQLLKDALSSLANQSYKNWEAIVVNDGGEDVEESVRSVDHGGRIRLLNHWGRLGQAAARNTALRLTQGQIICYLDDDDTYLPEHLEGIVKAMLHSGSPFLYTGAIKITESLEGGNRVELSSNDIEDSLRTDQTKLLAWNFIPLPTWAHRRECLTHVGFFHEGMSSHEDWDILIRLSLLWDFLYTNRKTVEIRVRPTANDSVTTRNTFAKLRDFRIIYDRYPTPNQDIASARRRILSDLGAKHENWRSYCRHKIRQLLDRHILWRIKARS